MIQKLQIEFVDNDTDERRVGCWSHVPRVGETIGFGDDRWFIVTRVWWETNVAQSGLLGEPAVTVNIEEER